MDKKIEKLRKEKLEEYKINKIAYLLDKKDTLQRDYLDKALKISKRIDETKELEFIPQEEGTRSSYYGGSSMLY